MLRTLFGALHRKFGVIILTGQGATKIAVQAWKLGALDFLEKPCDPALLLEVVEDAFAKVEETQQAAAISDRAESAMVGLSPPERNVLDGLIEGQANKVIAHNLDISPRTVELYRSNKMATSGVKAGDSETMPIGAAVFSKRAGVLWPSAMRIR
jgi:two-component system, LuxR family, response regulator FixJ